MPFVVTEPCVKCKYTDCVAVCPVSCFHEGENMLVIDPVECIDCGACVPECPAEAIFLDDDVPEKWKEYIALNERLAEQWPVLSNKRDPLPDADAWKGRADKRDQLSEVPGAGD